jgi:hypothetical protein
MQSKRAIQFIPLLIGLKIMTGKGTGIGGTASSVAYYNQLSVDLTNDIGKSSLVYSDHAGPAELSSNSGPPKPDRVEFTHCQTGRALTFLKHRVLFYVNRWK